MQYQKVFILEKEWILLIILNIYLLSACTSLSIPLPKSGKRVALVLGNAAYEQADKTLESPVNDAQDVANLLTDLGFDHVILETNFKTEDQDDLLKAFRRVISPGDIALVYYSGHGFQYQGNNFFVPVDADQSRVAEMSFKSLSLSQIANEVEYKKPALKIFILDACRSYLDTSQGQSKPSLPIGLSDEVELLGRSFIAHATSPGSTAADILGQRNSLFTKHMLENIQKYPVRISALFDIISEEVRREKNDQRPWSGKNSNPKFFFKKPEFRIPIPVI